MIFVLAIGQLTWHISSWSGLEYIYYHKVQHPFNNNEHQYWLKVISIYIISLLLSIYKLL